MVLEAQSGFEDVFDRDEVQALVLIAALEGNDSCREQLPALVSMMDEPYRDIAAIIDERFRSGEFLDRNVLAGVVGRSRLFRRDANGSQCELTASEVMNLLAVDPIQPGQAEEYLDLLKRKTEEQRRQEQKLQMRAVFEQHWDAPEQLQAELGRLATRSTEHGESGGGLQSELQEVVPYMAALEQRQSGAEFQGLDSGFQHLNYICDGLNTGLFVLAAPPGEGKTTLAWQIACQVAAIESLPVIFVSMEQSKGELRDKALARLSGVSNRHIRRGRLEINEPAWEQVLAAATEYAITGQFIKIIEGDNETCISQIRQDASDFMRRCNATRCLIVVDYLQIIPLEKEEFTGSGSTKDKVDRHVSDLRRLARDLNACVMAISSENRAGYGKKAVMNVFKESGGIEYSADIAAILSRDKHAEPNDEYRMQDLMIVKNRNGEQGCIRFKFFLAQARFEETERGELQDEEEDVNG
jgi:replicative DNA helicase